MFASTYFLGNGCRLMPSSEVPGCDLTPEERCSQVAAILAQGVFRHRHAAELAHSGELSRNSGPGLELVSKTRLSVSQGLANKVAPESEANDGRTA